MAFGPLCVPEHAYMPSGWSLVAFEPFNVSYIYLYALGLEYRWPSGLFSVLYMLACLRAKA